MSLKKLLLGFAVLAFAWTGSRASAGNVKVGLEVGGSLSNWTGEDAKNVPSVDELSSRLGFIGGGFLQFGLGPNFAVALEALYSQEGSSAKGGGQSGTFDLSYLTFPVLVKYYIPAQGFAPNLFAGASVGVNVVNQIVSDGDSQDFLDEPATQVGLVFGVGADIDKFMVNLRYQLGLSEIQEDVDVKNGVFSLMVGYSFI